jgi:hypothetical protein
MPRRWVMLSEPECIARSAVRTCEMKDHFICQT